MVVRYVTTLVRSFLPCSRCKGQILRDEYGDLHCLQCGHRPVTVAGEVYANA